MDTRLRRSANRKPFYIKTKKKNTNSIKKNTFALNIKNINGIRNYDKNKNKMKHIYIFIIITIIGLNLNAQQDPQFAHHMYNKFYYNPGAAGMGEEICANVINRQQWVGFEGAPTTTSATINGAFKILNKPTGLGLAITNDKLGALQNFQIKLGYSYHINLWSGKLGIGLETGMMNQKLDGQWDPPQSPSDPQMPQDKKSKTIFDLGIGAFFQQPNKYYVGISISHIHNPKIEYTDAATSTLRRHFYATAGYNQRFFNSPIELQPAVIVKLDGTILQYDLNLTATYNKKFRIGVSYRDRDAILPMIGVQLFNGLNISYSYEIPLTKMIKASSGTHEIFLGYCFNFWKPDTKYKYRSIRYL